MSFPSLPGHSLFSFHPFASVNIWSEQLLRTNSAPHCLALHSHKDGRHLGGQLKVILQSCKLFSLRKEKLGDTDLVLQIYRIMKVKSPGSSIEFCSTPGILYRLTCLIFSQHMDIVCYWFLLSLTILSPSLCLSFSLFSFYPLSPSLYLPLGYSSA